MFLYCIKRTTYDIGGPFIYQVIQYKLAVTPCDILVNQVLCRPPGGGPRLDRQARIQFGAGTFWRKTMKNQPGTMKNHENHETTLKNHRNQPKTMKNPETT